MRREANTRALALGLAILALTGLTSCVSKSRHRAEVETRLAAEEQIVARDRRVNALEGQVAELEAQVSRLQDQVRELEAEIHRLEEEAARLARESAMAHAEREQRLADVEAALEGSRDQLVAAQQKVTERDTRIHALEAELDRIEGRLPETGIERVTIEIGCTGDDGRCVEVYYGTDRTRGDDCREVQRAPGPTGRCLPNDFYSSDSAGRLEVGRLAVTLPPNHTEGKVERPLTILTVQIEDEDPERHVVLRSIETISERESWQADVAQRAGPEGERTAMIFVHGYNVSFDEAARQTAQIAYDLDFEGLPLLYSWPSQGKLRGYYRDEETVEMAEPYFAEFLDLLEGAGIDKLHLVAHSMGNRLVANTLFDWAQSNSDQKLFDQLVLAAPDVAVDDFQEKFAETLPALAARATLYASSNDVALTASNVIHKGRRAGHVDGGLLGNAGSFDTIDASAVKTDFLSHSYYAQGESVLADIFCLLEGIPAVERNLLYERGGGVRPYWQIVPAVLKRGGKTVCTEGKLFVTPAPECNVLLPWLLTAGLAIVVVALLAALRRR